MRIVACNHFEGLILLFQNELRSQRLDARGACRRDRVRIRGGLRNCKRLEARTRCDDSAACEYSQFACDTAKELLLVALHVCPLPVPGILVATNYIPSLGMSRYISVWRVVSMAFGMRSIRDQQR